MIVIHSRCIPSLFFYGFFFSYSCYYFPFLRINASVIIFLFGQPTMWSQHVWVHLYKRHEKSKWVCGCVGGPPKPECRDLCWERKWTVKGHTSSLTEITICPEKKREYQREALLIGLCRSPLENNSFTWRNAYGTNDLPYKLPIDLNSPRT